MFDKEKWHIGVCLVALTLVSFYQNCSNTGYQASNLYNTSSISPGACAVGDTSCMQASAAAPSGLLSQPIASRLYLSVKSPNPISVPSGAGAFEVDGDCGSGGFPSTSVIWSLNSNGVPVSSGNQALCDSLGRLRLLVAIPAGVSAATSNAVSLELVGIQSDGTVVHHPQGFAKATIQVAIQ